MQKNKVEVIIFDGQSDPCRLREWEHMQTGALRGCGSRRTIRTQLMRPQRAWSRLARGLQGSCSNQSILTEVSMLIQGEAEVPPRWEWWLQPPPHLLGSHVSTNTSKVLWGVEWPETEHITWWHYCDLAEWIMAGSTLFHFPNRKQTTGGLDSGHTAEPTLGISLLSVFKYPPYLVFVNYFLKCTEFGLKTNHQNGSQHKSKARGRSNRLIWHGHSWMTHVPKIPSQY